jgi:transcriptional regulator with XRE-family HTH domain
MPRRLEPDPLSLRIGARVRALRLERGLTLEKLAFESELGSKGHLSDLERGLLRPTVHTLKLLADHLEVELYDLLVFPDDGVRAKLLERLRHEPDASLRRLLAALPTQVRPRLLAADGDPARPAYAVRSKPARRARAPKRRS